MADEKQVMKLKFAPLDPVKDERGKTRKQSPVVEINNGDYNRKFIAKDQPFECKGLTRKDGDSEVVLMTAEEEVNLLLASGHFVLADSPKTEEKAAKV